MSGKEKTEKTETEKAEAVGRFDYVSADASQVERMNRVRDGFKALEEILNELPPSRLLSVAFTQLELAAMAANKSITHEAPAPKKAE